MRKVKRREWQPSAESQGIMNEIYTRLQFHQLKEGDYYFLFTIAKEALHDRHFGPKLDRMFQQAIAAEQKGGGNG